jgi:hypothetical protein
MSRRAPFDPAKATPSTPMRLKYVARFLGLNENKVYDAVRAGYQVQYPRIGLTTPRHFLDWASQPVETPVPSQDSERQAASVEELMARARETKAAQARPQRRQSRAADRSHESKSSRG